MGRTTRKFILMFFLAVVFLMAGNAFSAGDKGSGALIPENLTVADVFEAGIGMPVGKILLVTGDALILHSDKSRAYRAQKGLPLYSKDTVITLEKARLRLSLNDGSMTTMSSGTRLTLTKSDFDPKNKSRSTFLGMETGKARFWAVKMKDYKHSEFKVKTKTAVAGVRGSDFVIQASDTATEVIALKNTLLDLISLYFPDEDPVLLSDFQRSRVMENVLPSAAEAVDLAEVEQMMKEFLFAGERYDPERMIQSEHAAGEKATENEAEEGSGDQEALTKRGIFLPDEALYKLDLMEIQNILEGFRSPDFTGVSDFQRIEDNARDQQSDFSAVRREMDAALDLEQLPGPVEGP